MKRGVARSRVNDKGVAGTDLMSLAPSGACKRAEAERAKLERIMEVEGSV